MQSLSREEIVQLIQAVFPKMKTDRKMAILVDVPNSAASDTPDWAIRRQIAYEWYQALQDGLSDLQFDAVFLFAYPSVDSNNADLPEHAYSLFSPVPKVISDISQTKTTFVEIFSSHQIFLAPTQFSATAPLKVNAKKYGFRAATMPGFSPAMIPALRIDYGLVNQRCQLMKEKLDPAIAANVRFLVDGADEYHVHFDLRFRSSHASGGRFPDPGTAGNLPSGETYIVPYEGERGEKSQTNGTLPVQFGEQVVLFEINANRAIGVLSKGSMSEKQAAYLQREPAYGNMAELGFGILSDFGLEPIGAILLDEKLAFHIAFGRSDHFDGVTGPDKFSSPQAVVHIDYIYSAKTQNRISISSIDLVYPDGEEERIIQKNQYMIF
ncbi:hypothetical protein EH223_06150 [candidate division KSB1 bacterium]|nr:hypothetical protein [candidate division KSB1 bacterium]RQW05021.1 MAG: hypothetical protein EH223_06150 [candidate division KSB1 bacterium]